ncbi:MAG: hypothetical protein JO339_29445 [Alphaproteobacteria bacterium]|nr:hypothetical protein [Alphaproteobacteria bacterium]
MDLTPDGGPDLIRDVVPADYSPPGNKNQVKVAALAFFLSLDLAGSTALKIRQDNWADVIRYFYGQAVEQVQDAESTFRVWKYIGDEVVFYTYTSDLAHLQDWISIGFRSERSILDALIRQFPDLEGRVSVKGIAWIAPVTGYADLDVSGADANAITESLTTAGNLRANDLSFRDTRDNVDFIGPSIDAGFRLARFARPLQLVVSPALAYYFLKGAKRTNDFRVVGFESLKGVARGELYPAVWYHENWERGFERFRVRRTIYGRRRTTSVRK